MKKTILFSTLISIGVLLILFYFFYRKNTEIVFVDNIKLFNEYNLKKDLEHKLSPPLHRQRKVLDSLNTAYQNAPNDSIIYNYKKAEAAYDKIYNQINNEITETVWNRLNDLIKSYGKKKGYKIIIGANGMGTILYGDDASDITEDMINYVNKSYEG